MVPQFDAHEPLPDPRGAWTIARMTARQRIPLRLCLVLLLAIASSAIAAPPEELKDAIAARLLLMDDVARYKWNHSLPVVDTQREAALLERTTADAVAIGMPKDYARRVVAAQIEASRTIQLQLVAGWQREKQPPFADVPDLAAVQRPAIDAATHRLLEQLHTAMCTLAEETAPAELQSVPPPLSQQREAWSIATAALWPVPTAVCRR